MGRLTKTGIDYFPHQCSHGETMFILERKFQNDGYATWFKILEALGKKTGHYLDCSNPRTMEYMLANTHLNEARFCEILALLATLEAVDSELWDDHKVIWSDNFISGIAGVYGKRTTDIPLKPDFRDGKPRKEDDEGVSAPKSTQSRVEKSKEEQSKDNRGGKKGGHFEDKLPEIKEQLISLSLKISESKWAKEKNFNPYAFIQASVKFHPEAIIHTLLRLNKEGELIKTPWAWAIKIVEEESKNHHARDGEAKHIATIKAFKKVIDNFDFSKLGGD